MNDELKKQLKIKEELKQLKFETANELGINLDEVPSHATSTQIGTFAGPVGGEMVRKLVEQAQKELINQTHK